MIYSNDKLAGSAINPGGLGVLLRMQTQQVLIIVIDQLNTVNADWAPLI